MHDVHPEDADTALDFTEMKLEVDAIPGVDEGGPVGARLKSWMGSLCLWFVEGFDPWRGQLPVSGKDLLGD